MLGTIQYVANHFPKILENTNSLRKLLKLNKPWEWGYDQEKEFNRIKRMLTEKPYLAPHAKHKEKKVTTDASKTGVGITLWQKQDTG